MSLDNQSNLDVVFVLQQFGAAEVDEVRAAARNVRHKMLLFETGIGVHRARNVGLKNASGDIIAFVDDDCRLNVGWLCGIMGPYSDPLVGGVGGFVRHPMRAGLAKRWLYRLGGIEGPRYRIDWGGFHSAPVFRLPERAQVADWLSGVNMSFRRRVVAEVGEFDESYGHYGFDDVDYCLRARQKGWVLIATPDASNEHFPSAVNRTNIRAQLCAEEARRVRFVQKAIGRNRFWVFRYLLRFGRYWIFSWLLAAKRRDFLVPMYLLKGSFVGLSSAVSGKRKTRNLRISSK